MRQQLNSVRMRAMPETLTCRFRIGEGGPVEEVQATFPDEDWALLIEFLHYADQLFSLRAAEFRLSVKLHWAKDTGISVSGEMPHDDDIATLLHRMRPFVLQKESTYLTKVCNVLSRF